MEYKNNFKNLSSDIIDISNYLFFPTGQQHRKSFFYFWLFADSKLVAVFMNLPPALCWAGLYASNIVRGGGDNYEI